MEESLERKAVLIIDSDKASREGITALLSQKGIDVFEADTSTEGLKLIETIQPHLLLWGPEKYDLSIREVCEQVRRCYTKFQLPIIIVTPSADKETIDSYLLSGADDYIEKSLSSIVFSSRVENYLGHVALWRAAEKAASQRLKFETLGLFSSGVAHNFNNLLSGILGASDLLRKFARGDDRAERCVEVIRSSVTAGKTLTRKLSALLHKNTMSAQNGFDLVEAIQTVVDCYVEASQSTSFILKVPQKLPFVSMTNANFVDILANLLANACDATQENGHVEIAAYTHEQSIVLIVKDDGRGIAPDQQTRIFEPFYSTKYLDSQRGVSCSGNGLGLWIVYNLVKASKGEVFVESEVGKGTTITVRLPISENKLVSAVEGPSDPDTLLE